MDSLLSFEHNACPAVMVSFSKIFDIDSILPKLSSPWPYDRVRVTQKVSLSYKYLPAEVSDFSQNEEMSTRSGVVGSTNRMKFFQLP